MKKLLPVIFLTLLATCAVLGCDPVEGRPKKETQLVLCGKVKEIQLQKRDGEINHVSATVVLEITNTGSRTIIVMPDRIRVFGGSGKVESGRTFAYYSNYGPSRLPSYEDTRKTYDKPAPNFDKVVLIKPGESWDFSDILMLEYSENAMIDGALSWASVKAQSPFYLTVGASVSESHLAKGGKAVEAKRFWLSLRNKWSKYGYLWLDNIESDKMLLDLRSLPVKITDSEYTTWNTPKKCSEWQSRVDPEVKSPTAKQIVYDAITMGELNGKFDVKESSFSNLSQGEALEAMDCLIKLRGRKHDSKIKGPTRPDTSQTFDASSVEVAALYWISAVYLQRWGHAGAAALRGKNGLNSNETISKAYDSYEKWLVEIRKIGLDEARLRELDPLAGTGISWY